MSARSNHGIARTVTGLMRRLTPVMDVPSQPRALPLPGNPTLKDADLTRFYAWRVARSSALVRRLLFRSHDDPGKRRILKWLLAVDDARLLQFGLTHDDIAVLRTTARGQ